VYRGTVLGLSQADGAAFLSNYNGVTLAVEVAVGYTIKSRSREALWTQVLHQLHSRFSYSYGLCCYMYVCIILHVVYVCIHVCASVLVCMCKSVGL